MKESISREGYLFVTWFCLILGLVGTAVFSTYYLFDKLNAYYPYFWAFSMCLVGFGMGLAVSRAFEIRGYK